MTAFDLYNLNFWFRFHVWPLITVVFLGFNNSVGSNCSFFLGLIESYCSCVHPVKLWEGLWVLDRWAHNVWPLGGIERHEVVAVIAHAARWPLLSSQVCQRQWWWGRNPFLSVLIILMVKSLCVIFLCLILHMGFGAFKSGTSFFQLTCFTVMYLEDNFLNLDLINFLFKCCILNVCVKHNVQYMILLMHRCIHCE